MLCVILCVMLFLSIYITISKFLILIRKCRKRKVTVAHYVDLRTINRRDSIYR